VTDQGVIGMKVDGSVVVVTGGTGLLGQSVSRVLRAAGAQVLAVGRRDFDLRQHRQVYDMLRSIRPDAVVHLAANRHGAGESVLSHYDNVIMGVELLEGCRRQRVGKVLLAERSCAFPVVTPDDIDQVAVSGGTDRDAHDDVNSATDARLDADADLDAAAHQMLRTHLDVYRQSAGLDVSALALTNVYDASPGYSPELSAAVDVMLAAVRSAMADGRSQVRLRTTGSPTTELLHVNDAAHLVRAALETDEPEPSLRRSVTLAEVGALVATHTGYRGSVAWSPAVDLHGPADSAALESMRDFVDWYARTGAGAGTATAA
jgi:GDP-L-fucose synthase